MLPLMAASLFPLADILTINIIPFRFVNNQK